MTISDTFENALTEHARVIDALVNSQSVKDTIGSVAGIMTEAFRSGNKLLLCGNGGSAADAQHIATEFVCRFFLDRKAINAETLTVNTSSLTAITNDYGFETVFTRQVEAKGSPGDILIGITTSGTSKNVLAALEKAKEMGMVTVGFTGMNSPGRLQAVCDYILNVPSDCTPRIQECHILLGHILCEFIERTIATV